MGETKISWADKVWNPVTGCTKVSAGCKNCYAERMSKRLAGRCGYPAENPFAVTLHPDKLNEPLRWRKPSRIFVCSMGDLFHEDVADEFIMEVFAKMLGANHHKFLLLTKRPARMKEFVDEFLNIAFQVGRKSFVGQIPDSILNDKKFYDLSLNRIVTDGISHILLGVSVEDQKTADERIPLLLQTPAAKRFVSYEPALGPVDFEKYLFHPECDSVGCDDDCTIFEGKTEGLDQIIMGGESGPGARPLHPDWARSVRDQCKAAGVAFFLKQNGEWAPDGGVPFKEPKKAGRVIPMYTVWSSAGANERGKLSSYHIYDENGQGTRFKKVGKKAAGCLLDGVEHKEMP